MLFNLSDIGVPEAEQLSWLTDIFASYRELTYQSSIPSAFDMLYENALDKNFDRRVDVPASDLHTLEAAIRDALSNRELSLDEAWDVVQTAENSDYPVYDPQTLRDAEELLQAGDDPSYFGEFQGPLDKLTKLLRQHSGSTIRTAVIKKCRKQDMDDRPASEQKWCLYTHDGKKLLGRHPTEEAAKKQERAIHVHKGFLNEGEKMRTKHAGYDTDESVADELKLYMDNESDLYDNKLRSIYPGLVRKLAAGRYNSEMAVAAFAYLVERGAKKYAREFGTSEREWSQMFPKNIRQMVATEYRDEFESEVRNHEYDFEQWVPKKYQGVDLADMLKKRSDLTKGATMRERTAKKWKSLPRGWNKESMKDYWDSVGGSVSKCVKGLEGTDIDDPGAFCASLKDRLEGSGWRHEKRSSAAPKYIKVAGRIYVAEGGPIDASDHFDQRKMDEEVVQWACDDDVLDYDGNMALNLSTELSSYGYSGRDVYNLLEGVGHDLPEFGSDEWEDIANDFLSYPEQYLSADKLTQNSALPSGGYAFGWDHNGAFGLMFYADLDEVNEIREQAGCEPYELED